MVKSFDHMLRVSLNSSLLVHSYAISGSPRLLLPGNCRYRKALSSLASTFTKHASSSKFQLYRSCSHDPYLNLAIERYLFEKTPEDSTVLLFYVNRPCVVIGRNQNPWLEVNLPQLRHNTLGHRVDLLRRRSGGGAVFHDYGNVNFSVIGPPAAFTRDRAVDMVVSALRHAEPTLFVNERHDIVRHLKNEPRKVSGSAYKLSRTRAMHHATCLIDSPNLPLISSFLSSPAAPYIKAKGVESVRSRIANLFPGRGEHGIRKFIEAVSAAFSQIHGVGLESRELLDSGGDAPPLKAHASTVCGVLSKELLDIDSIDQATQELSSPAWVFGATPAFTFSSSASHESAEDSTSIYSWRYDVTFSARGGIVTGAFLQTSGHNDQRTFDFPFRE